MVDTVRVVPHPAGQTMLVALGVTVAVTDAVIVDMATVLVDTTDDVVQGGPDVVGDVGLLVVDVVGAEVVRLVVDVVETEVNVDVGLLVTDVVVDAVCVKITVLQEVDVIMLAGRVLVNISDVVVVEMTVLREVEVTVLAGRVLVEVIDVLCVEIDPGTL